MASTESNSTASRNKRSLWVVPFPRPTFPFVRLQKNEIFVADGYRKPYEGQAKMDTL